MPRDGKGNYNLPNPAVVTLTVIESADENETRDDIASALTQSFSRDGQTIATGNWNLGNKRITTLATPVAGQDAVNKNYVDIGDVWELIGDTAATATGSIDFTWTAGDYRAIHVLVQGVVPAAAGASIDLVMRVRRAGAYLSGASAYVTQVATFSAAAIAPEQLTTSAWYLTRGGTNSALHNTDADVMVYPGGTGIEPGFTCTSRHSADTLGRVTNTMSGGVPATGVIDGVRLLWASGTNFAASGRIIVLGYKSTSTTSTATPLSEIAANDLSYDFGEGLLPDSAATNTLSLRLARDITIPADFAGSVGGCEVNPTNAADFDVAVDGVSIGTATISTLGAVTWVSDTPGVPVSVAAGSVVTISAPIPQDATLETVNFTIAAHRVL